MNFIKKEIPLVVSITVFTIATITDYFFPFMQNITSLNSGPRMELLSVAGLVSVLTLGFLEGILGLDNATVLAMQVRHLKPEMAHRALTWGVWGAHLFRFLFLLVAGWILKQTWIMALGGVYLAAMAVEFFVSVWAGRVFMLISFICSGFMFGQTGQTMGIGNFEVGIGKIFFLLSLGYLGYMLYHYYQIRNKRKPEVSEHDVAQLKEKDLPHPKFGKRLHPLIPAIIAVEWTDILFSFDSIGVGVAMTRDYWILFWGAFFGVTCLRLFAKQFVKLLQKYPGLEHGAMLAVAIVGVKLFYDAMLKVYNLPWPEIHNWHTSLAIVIIFSLSFLIKGDKTAAHR